MPKFTVRETQAQWVTHVYFDVDAATEEEAKEKVSGAKIDHDDVDFGDYFGDCSYKVIRSANDE